jgi:hypothetical protein
MMAKYVNMAMEIAMKASIYNTFIKRWCRDQTMLQLAPYLRVESCNRASLREALRIDLVVYNIGFGNKNGGDR